MKHFQVPLFKNDYSFKELFAILKVFFSKWLSMGKQTFLFEKELAKFLKIPSNVLAVSNGTAGIELALKLANIQPGDEVLIPALTFVADLNTVVSIKAQPILVDCKSYTDWNLDPQDIKKKITSKTKAIIYVHYAGYPVDIDEISQIAKENNIMLIEDAAHAIGSRYKKQACGSFGDFSIFSFYANKNLSAGEGGALIIKNEGLFHKAYLMRSHGINYTSNHRMKSNIVGYDVQSIGFNYRITEISSAIARIQLKKLNKNIYKRKRLCNYYISLLQNSCEIPFLDDNDLKQSSYHIFPILLPRHINRDHIIQKLKEAKIQTSIHYPSFKSFSYYAYLKDKTPIADDISNRALTLPLFPRMSMSDVRYVVKHLQTNITE